VSSVTRPEMWPVTPSDMGTHVDCHGVTVTAWQEASEMSAVSMS